ncbi:BatA domain-containing protein [Pseudobythopirellula maris]|uniref:BatA domain-containing protein n=1 Tax=Pseudobythopirellula maris TaxID=2527991 RepID=UPI0018D449EC|nr:BatA domain-containing protein [Pseudobythopirellula maris]
MNQIVLAFGFANLAILGWVAAAAAPIVIHLWMRQTHRETPWAAIRFLKAALERHAKRLRLQQWILLAIRTLILLLITLAAAKPFLDAGLGDVGVRTHRVLVLDASASMRLAEGGPDGPSRLVVAKRLATELVSGSRGGDLHSVIVAGGASQSPLAQPAGDRSRVVEAISRIEPTDGVADLAETLRLAERLVERADAVGSRVERTEVIVYTDLAANTWGALEGAAAAEGAPASYAATIAVASGGLRSVVDSLAELATVSVVDVGLTGAPNRAVSRVEIADPLPTSSRPVRITAEVSRFGAAAAQNDEPVVAELVVDGLPVDEQRLQLAPDQPTVVEFSHTFKTPGERVVEVRLGADALTIDNSRRLVVGVRPHVRVLLVAGRRDAARYVADALNPTGSRDAALRPLVVSDAELATLDFAEYDAVFFCNVARLTQDETTRLERYVRGGGGVIFFLGDRVDAERYNRTFGSTFEAAVWRPGRDNPFRLLGSDRRSEQPSFSVAADHPSSPLLPAALGEPVSRASYRVDPLEYGHPIVAPFRGREAAGLLTTPVSRYFPLAIEPHAADKRADHGTARVALTLENGDPLLVTVDHGAGRCAWFTTDGSLASVDPAGGEPWTALPAWPSFLPLVHETLRYVASGVAASGGVLVGEPITVAAAAGARRLEVDRPDQRGETIDVPADSEEWTYAGADRAGVYRFTAEGGAAPLRTVAVNVDPRESDPRRASAERFPRSVTVRRGGDTVAGDQASTLGRWAVHRWMLHIALALVLLETLLAQRFGRARA